MTAFDHIAVLCERLEEGVAHVEAALDLPVGPGGRHEAFGTHNALMRLGGEEYLEVIAVDPDAPAPGRPRWFDLDRFAGPPRLARWVCRVDDLAAAVAEAPEVGVPMDLARGDYRWAMAVPGDGVLPLDNLHPALIEWRGPHPAPALEDVGARLGRLIVGHAEVDRLDGLRLDDRRLLFTRAEEGLAAQIETPGGPKWLR